MSSITHVVQSGENWTDLAEQYYKERTRYQRIIDANPQYASRPPHFSPSDNVTLPVLYPGDKVSVPIDPKPKEETESAETKQAESAGTAAINTSTNSASIGVFSQHPSPRIELYEFKDGGLFNYMNYDGRAQDGCKHLLSYEFSEAVDNINGSFSFEAENETDKDGNTTFDRIKPRSIVKIYEGDEKPRFIGAIRRKSMGNMMTAQGPKKTVVFSGCSLMGLVSDFVLSLDIKIMGVSDAETASKQLTIGLTGERTIAGFLKTTLDAYVGLTVRTFKVGDSETVNILKKLTNDGLDIFTHGTHDGGFQYDIASAVYRQGQNSIVDMWRNILPNPVYEIYGYCAREGGMKVMVREAPFDADTWAGLNCTRIEPISLKSYSLQQSDEEVYTVFNSWVEGSAMSHDFYTVLKQYEMDEDSLGVDKDKLARYGYRPLEIAFRGYDRSRNIDNGASELPEKFKAVNERARRWYSRLDEMLSGVITITSNFAEPDRNPRAGEKAAFLGGEFYIKGAAHSWRYGGNPSIKLAVARGAVYENGEMTGTVKRIGGERRELEE